jgi:outer membrane protein assembly factor BamD
MKKNNIIAFIILLAFASCAQYNKVVKSTDYEYKYEAAKQYFVDGKYSRASFLLSDLITILKGSDKAEESLYMLGMCYYNQADYATSAQYFKTYYNTYPRGDYAQEAHFRAGLALYLDSPEPRLDQTDTYGAINEMQVFMEYYPKSKYMKKAEEVLFALQDKLVEKEFISANLYFNLGNYMGNNYRSCIITAKNALKDYPYTDMREELCFLILKARYEMAKNSVEKKKKSRFRETVDEYYAFKNEFPESKYNKEAERIFKKTSKYLNE